MKNTKLIKLQKTFTKQLKDFKPSKTFIGSVALLIGISGTLLAQNITNKTGIKKYHPTHPQEDIITNPPQFPTHHNRLFNDNFFDHSFFEEMNQIQREMDRSFRRQQARMEKIFYEKPRYKNFITKKETKDEYIYKLHFTGYKKEDIQIEVKNQTLNISANNSQKEQHQYSSSNFYYSFYLPKFDVTKQPQIARENGNITITLRK